LNKIDPLELRKSWELGASLFMSWVEIDGNNIDGTFINPKVLVPDRFVTPTI